MSRDYSVLIQTNCPASFSSNLYCSNGGTFSFINKPEAFSHRNCLCHYMYIIPASYLYYNILLLLKFQIRQFSFCSLESLVYFLLFSYVYIEMYSQFDFSASLVIPQVLDHSTCEFQYEIVSYGNPRLP